MKEKEWNIRSLFFSWSNIVFILFTDPEWCLDLLANLHSCLERWKVDELQLVNKKKSIIDGIFCYFLEELTLFLFFSKKTTIICLWYSFLLLKNCWPLFRLLQWHAWSFLFRVLFMHTGCLIFQENQFFLLVTLTILSF